MDKIEVKFKFYKFQDKSSFFAIGVVEHEEKDLTVKGNIKGLVKDKLYDFYGEHIDDQKWGKQFDVVSFERTVIKNKNGVMEYLSGGLVEGIGSKRAEAIYNALGDNAIEKIVNSKDVLNDVEGMTDLLISKLHTKLKKEYLPSKIKSELLSYGFSRYNVETIYDEYKEDTLTKFKENPYDFCKLKRLPFPLLDSIVLENEILSEYSDERVLSAISHILEDGMLNLGHTYFLVDYIEKQLVKYLGDDLFDNIDFNEILKKGILDKYIVVEKNRIYDYETHKRECYIVDKIKTMINANNSVVEVKKSLDIIEKIEEQYSITYSEQQKEAITGVLNSKVSVITGGPGTGKTTVINAIISVYCQLKGIDSPESNILLLAPTGKAAKRMEESTKVRAYTTHRGLNYNPDQIKAHEGFGFNMNNQLEEDLIIIDETSMIDINLFYRLISAIKDESKIVIVGDVNQLPSIGAGEILNDLINSERINTYRLETIYRQAEQSYIIKLAHSILRGELPSDFEDKHDQFMFVEEDSETAIETIKHVTREYIGKKYSINSDIQVLAPMYRRECGVDQINNEVREIVKIKNVQTVKFMNREYTIGDKIIQLRNNTDLKIMNGDIGVIESIKLVNTDGGNYYIAVNFDGEIVTLEFQDLADITHAYGITIHKSQGSEYKITILPMLKGHSFMLNKKLIYTAITRAKEMLVIVGSKELFEKSIKKEIPSRQSTLTKRLDN